jgi:hypothetical protein
MDKGAGIVVVLRRQKRKYFPAGFQTARNSKKQAPYTRQTSRAWHANKTVTVVGALLGANR